ncbi:MAG: bile acid:sodium symporter family protein [Pseudomonadota bacterium]
MLLEVFLPLSLAFIMFSLGYGLTISDFTRVVKFPKAFAMGAVAQIVMLPLIAFTMLHIFSLPPELAVGVMILAFCPGGVTSNIFSKLADGAVALSVTMTAIMSLLAVVTVPLLVSFSNDYFLGVAAPEINVTTLGIQMFLLTAVPVGIGVALRAIAPRFADIAEPWTGRIAVALFALIVVGAIASNWSLFLDNLPTLGPILIILNAVLLVLGVILSRTGGLNMKESKTIAIETGVQNATLGIAIGSLIVGQTLSSLPAFALPSGVYGITMYFVMAPFIIWARSAAGSNVDQQPSAA